MKWGTMCPSFLSLFDLSSGECMARSIFSMHGLSLILQWIACHKKGHVIE